ncbi:MAG: MlaD family protein [Kiritimatiellia bacterium]
MKSDRMKEMSMEVTVGAFMFMVLLTLGFFTIVLSQENIFKPGYEITASFSNVLGLREGDNVFVHGVDVGKVKALTVTRDGVELVARLEVPLTFHEDYRIEILPSSVLGGRYLHIFAGTAASPLLPEGTKLHGVQPIDLLDEATEAVMLLREAFDEGGMLDDLKEAIAEFRDLGKNLNAGEGTFGKLMTDDELYDNLKAITASFKDVADRLDKGEGSIGKLLSDEAVYNDLKAFAEDMREISDRVAEGKGTIGKLLSEDEQVYKDITDLVKSLKEVSESLNSTEGTIGRLVKDDEIYQEAKKLIREIRATIDDMRETSPITTFTSIFFGAF